MTGGAFGASALPTSAKIGLTGLSAFTIGSVGEVAGSLARGDSPSVRDVVASGLANVIGAGSGGFVKPGATAIATTTKAPVKSHPVSSLSGRVFYTVNTPGSSSTNQAAATALQSSVGEVAAASANAAESKLREK